MAFQIGLLAGVIAAGGIHGVLHLTLGFGIGEKSDLAAHKLAHNRGGGKGTGAEGAGCRQKSGCAHKGFAAAAPRRWGSMHTLLRGFLHGKA